MYYQIAFRSFFSLLSLKANFKNNYADLGHFSLNESFAVQTFQSQGYQNAHAKRKAGEIKIEMVTRTTLMAGIPSVP